MYPMFVFYFIYSSRYTTEDFLSKRGSTFCMFESNSCCHLLTSLVTHPGISKAKTIRAEQVGRLICVIENTTHMDVLFRIVKTLLKGNFCNLPVYHVNVLISFMNEG